MKLVGLITEYNPFHNGHQYHIEQALKVTGADAAVVVMSGSYVQRGTPAFMPKHLRAKMALNCGAAIVLELPVIYATGSAEHFARGAVTLLNSLNCIDTICFGCEHTDNFALAEIARILVDEPINYKKVLQENLKNGYSFPVARQNALEQYTSNPLLSECLSTPNNILGIEYIKALYQLKSQMAWQTIKREGSNYHNSQLNDKFASATALRQNFDIDTVNEHIPPQCYKIFKDYHQTRYPVYENDFSLLLFDKLLSETKESLTDYVDISQSLANRIYNQLNNYQNFSQFCDLLKTKDLTYTRISRALLHVLLKIKKEDITLFFEHGTIMYARVLGFRKEYSAVLSMLNYHSNIPLIAKSADVNKIGNVGKQMWCNDLYATNLYEAVIANKYNCVYQNDYAHPLLSI